MNELSRLLGCADQLYEPFEYNGKIYTDIRDTVPKGFIFRTTREFIDRLEQVGRYILQFREELKLKEIIVFGSTARGNPMPSSDVDIMLLIDGSAEDAKQAQYFIDEELFQELELKYPPVDAHTMSYSRYYTDLEEDDVTIFGGFLHNVRKDGISIWRR